jgi:hypothetical protein
MLEVQDATGHVGQTSAVIRVADTTAPTGTPTFDAVINEGGRASFWSLVFVDNDNTFEQTRTDVWSFDEFGLWIELQGKEASHIFAKAGTFVVHLAVTDASGNTFATSFEVLVRDTTPPWITVFSPEEGALVPERNVVVTGHFEPGAMLYINGVAIDNLGSFAERVALAEGTNVVSFEVRDAAGNSITRHVGLTVDSSLPTIMVDAPPAGAVTGLTTLRIVGHVQDATAVVLTVAGVQVLVAAGGLFTVDVQLLEGANLLQLVAVDAAGHRTVVGFSVTRDTRAPQTLAGVIGAEAKDGVLTTGAASVDLAGAAEAGTSLQLCTQFASASPVCTPVTVGADGTFRVPVALEQGATTTITLKSTDAAGNEATQTFAVAQVVGAVTGPGAWAWDAALVASLALLGAAVVLMWRRRFRGTASEAAPEGTDEES